MKVQLQTVIQSFLIAFCALLFMAVNNDNSLTLAIIYLIVSFLIILNSILRFYRTKNLLSFVCIADIFVGCIFILRPIQLFLLKDIQSDFLLLNVSNYVNGSTNLADLPVAKAGFIGLLGIFGLNFFVPYQKIIKVEKHNKQSWYMKDSLSLNQRSTLVAFMAISLVSAAIFFTKVKLNYGIHIYDMLWIFLFSCICIYYISNVHKMTATVYFILACAIVISSLTTSRQYIVNLLLCVIIPLYFVGKSTKKTSLRVILLSIILLIIVLIFVKIRVNGQTILGVSYKSSIMDEFSMYEMLLLSLNYFKDHNIGLLYGYNYLTIFTMVIPGVNIEHFDHMLTRLVFSGTLGGGNPVSLFGSLYFNFSYFGVLAGSLLFARLLYIIQNKLSTRLAQSYDAIGYYTIFNTFVYDIIRVGDLGRELWTFLTLLFVFIIFNRIMKTKKVMPYVH